MTDSDEEEYEPKYKDIETTEEVEVPENLIDQVIGQDEGVEVIKKAAKQGRNVLLIGKPGTGKSMLAKSMSELLPTEELQDILVYPNQQDPNEPKVDTVQSGKGEKIVNQKKKLVTDQNQMPSKVGMSPILIMGLIYALGIGAAIYFNIFSDIILAAVMIVGGMLLAMLAFGIAVTSGLQGMQMPGKGQQAKKNSPKLLVDNSDKDKAPFVDATGARAGALLGDVKHDPFQSGGLGTPPHQRVMAGMIHKANKGVLYVDEVASLSPKSQQELLVAMQENKYSITGQSEMSSGAMVRTGPVPCDFLLIASGNMEDMKKMHPAIRSRIRGYGYEVYMNKYMEDNPENRDKLRKFIAQEVEKDGGIPHFKKEAVEKIIFEARRRASRKDKLTLKLRDLGGLVRAAGDVAKEENSDYVESEHIEEAKEVSKSLEKQISGKEIERKKQYQVFKTEGQENGKVNGLAVFSGGRENEEIFGGIMLPIEAKISPAQSKREGETIATGKLGEIAEEAVENVSAIVKKYKGTDISNFDIHIQFLQTYEGVEGDSASISVATAVISALEDVPVHQEIAMTGSLSVKGEVLPVGGVSEKIEAAIESGASKVIIPKSNMNDVVLEEDKEEKIEIIPAEDFSDVLKESLADTEKKENLIKEIKEIIKS